MTPREGARRRRKGTGALSVQIVRTNTNTNEGGTHARLGYHTVYVHEGHVSRRSLGPEIGYTATPFLCRLAQSEL